MVGLLRGLLTNHGTLPSTSTYPVEPSSPPNIWQGMMSTSTKHNYRLKRGTGNGKSAMFAPSKPASPIMQPEDGRQGNISMQLCEPLPQTVLSNIGKAG